jgi:hypothetical protein
MAEARSAGFGAAPGTLRGLRPASAAGPQSEWRKSPGTPSRGFISIRPLVFRPCDSEGHPTGWEWIRG